MTVIKKMLNISSIRLRNYIIADSVSDSLNCRTIIDGFLKDLCVAGMIVTIYQIISYSSAINYFLYPNSITILIFKEL